MVKKREKPEDFIGREFNNGKLKVVGIYDEKGKNGRRLFKVTCTECSKDPELFPDGYFTSTKGNLLKGHKPCGCSKKPEWFYWQYLILARRASVHNVINGGCGCPKCSNKYRPTEQEALQKCIDICKEMDYDVIGFVDGYKNNRSRFEYNCKTHRKQCVKYDAFVNGGKRCGGCAKEENIRRLREDGNGNGYYPERKDEIDFLYVLDFDGKFIKVGRSFDVDERIKDLRTPSMSGIRNIKKLRIFTATHQEIYDYEQELHKELRERNFQYPVSWSTECFENDSLYILNKLLDNCDFEEVQ